MKADSPTSLYQSFKFSDGGSSSNNNYANVNQVTNISYASDNPSGTTGTTAWEADFANLSMATGTRLGGKAASALQTDNATAWANIKTTFTVGLPLDTVKILDAEWFGTKSNLTKLYLQSSSDSLTWTTVGTLEVPSDLSKTNSAIGAGINIVFDGFTIPAKSYIRFGIALTASGSNSGLEFNGISFHSYTLCA